MAAAPALPPDDLYQEIARLSDPVVRLPRPSKALLKYLKHKKRLAYHQTPPITAHQIAAIGEADFSSTHKSKALTPSVPVGESYQCASLPEPDPETQDPSPDMSELVYCPHSAP